MAVGHSILVICWHVLTTDCDCQDLGGDWFARRSDTDKRRDDLIRQLHDLGGDWFARPSDTAKRRDDLIRQLHDLGYGVTLTHLAA